MMSYLYILRSKKVDEYYVGSSDNPEIRLLQHNQGFVKATKHKRPYELVFAQKFPTKNQARKAELKIKSWKRKDFIDKIVKNQKYYTGS